jgi:hypothetical protein
VIAVVDLDYARDLVMTGALFGLAAFIWAGIAQERPPAGIVWRIVLGALMAAGLVLLGFSLPVAIRYWDTPTTLTRGNPALLGYIIVFWLEIIAIVALAIFYARTKRPHLLAPTILIVVGVHFVPLALVFGQPIMMVVAVLVTAAGVAALLLPREGNASSFWCGILSAPVFLVIGTIALVAGAGALAA